MNVTFLERVRQMADDVARREGCVLYDVEFVGGSRGKGRTLRVYIDKKENGVSIDDCTNVSRGLNLLLDVEDVIPGEGYLLEVSSPGMDRVLRLPWHFEQVLGKKVQIKTFDSMEKWNPGRLSVKNRRQVSGRLVTADGSNVTIQADKEELIIPIEAISRAHLIYEFTSEDLKQKHEKERG